MTKSKKRGRRQRCARSAACSTSVTVSARPPTLDEIIAARPSPPLTVRQIRERWLGVFEPEFWEEVRRAARSS